MPEAEQNILERIVERYPVDLRLARILIEATIEEIHRLLCIKETSVHVARHIFRSISPEACAHLLAIMQSAASEADSDDQYFEECSQRLSMGRKLMLTKEAEWLDERPASLVETHRLTREARKQRREESRRSWSEADDDS